MQQPEPGQGQLATPAQLARARDMLIAAHAIQHVLSGSLPILLIFIRPQLDLSYTDLGLIVAVGNLTGGLAQMPAGLIVDRYGARRVLLWGYLLTLTSLIMFALSSSLGPMLLSRLVMGLGQATFHPASFPEMAKATRHTGVGMGMALHSIGGTLGMAGGYSITVVLATWLGWRWALHTMVACGAVLSVLFALTYPRLPDEPPDPVAPAGDIPSESTAGAPSPGWRPAIYLSAASMLSGAFSVSLTSFLPTYLTVARGATETIASGLSTIKLLSGTAGAFAGGKAGDTLDRSNVVLLSTGATAALVVVLTSLDLGTAGLLLTLVALGFAHAMARPCLNALTSEIAPRGRSGGVFGMVFGAMALGGSIAGPVVGWIADSYSLQTAFMAMSVLYLAHGVLIKWTYRHITTGLPGGPTG